MDEKLILDLRLGLDGVNKQLSSLRSQMESEGGRLGSSFSGSFSKALSIATGIAGAVATAASAIISVKTIKEAIDAAKEQEVAVNRLNAALATTGQYSEAASKALQDFASMRQAVTTFGDEVTLQSMSVIQSIARLDQEGLKRATVAAQDMAAALGMDLHQASMMVAKAAEGQIGSFQRLGIEIKNGATDAETFANAIKAIEERFGGRAESETKTFAGAIAQLKNSFSDTLEVLGEYIVKSPTLISVLNQISKAFVIIGQKIRSTLGNRDILGEFILTSVRVGIAVAEYILKPIEFVYHAILSVGKAAASVVTAAVAIFSYLGASITYVFEKLARFGSSIAGFVSDDLRDKINENFVTPLEEAKNAQLQVVENAKEATKELVLQAGQEFSEGLRFSTSNAILESLTEIQNNIPVFEELHSQSWENIKNKQDQKQQEILSANKAFWAGFFSGFNNGAKSIEQRAIQLGQQVQGSISQGFANGFAAMGAALVNGDNLMRAFGAAILSSFGDILIMLGQQILMVGVLMQAVPFLFGLQGAAAIAAGIGFMIAGGALKAFASNMSASSRASGAGRASASIGAPSTSVPVVGVGEVGTLGNIPTEEEREKKAATVNVTVQGNVFNQRETGLEIARIIRESFESEGVRVMA